MNEACRNNKKKTVLLLWSFVTLFVWFFLVFSQTLVLRPLYFLKKYTFLFGLWFLVKPTITVILPKKNINFTIRLKVNSKSKFT